MAKQEKVTQAATLPSNIQRQIIAMRDEAEYYQRRAEEASIRLSQFVSSLGLTGNVAFNVSIYQPPIAESKPATKKEGDNP